VVPGFAARISGGSPEVQQMVSCLSTGAVWRKAATDLAVVDFSEMFLPMLRSDDCGAGSGSLPRFGRPAALYVLAAKEHIQA
jgi:hypothetical protein